MKNDDPLSDLEARLRAWRPAELPPSLHTRLRAADPAVRRGGRLPRLRLAGACALALAVALGLTKIFLRSPDVDEGPAASPALRRTLALEISGTPRWALNDMKVSIYSGVPLGSVPAVWRLDEESVAGSGLLPVRSTDGKLPLKVDCQF